eukprot:357281-Chlamydomonas_euryale.AAC.18
MSPREQTRERANLTGQKKDSRRLKHAGHKSCCDVGASDTMAGNRNAMSGDFAPVGQTLGIRVPSTHAHMTLTLQGRAH